MARAAVKGTVVVVEPIMLATWADI